MKHYERIFAGDKTTNGISNSRDLPAPTNARQRKIARYKAHLSRKAKLLAAIAAFRRDNPEPQPMPTPRDV